MRNLCTAPNCKELVKSNGLCNMHLQRWTEGRPLDAPRYYNRLVKRGWVMGGYRWISTPDCGEILEHRYAMEKAIGRQLLTDEIVHHKNGDKLDNRLVNLELMRRDEHTSHHRGHALDCLICGARSDKGGNGLCSRHYAEVRAFLQRVGVEVLGHEPHVALIFMGIGLAFVSDDVKERIESLYP